MDTKDFSLFIHLAETLHFGQTGEAMHMSASAVSRNIRRIEEEVGQRLLERDNRSVRITESGRQFLDYARQALAQWQSFNEAVKQDATSLSGEVSVYCSVTAAYSVLAEILDSFRHRYPDIEIKLHTGDQADALQRILEGEEDIAIAARPDKLSARLQFQTLLHSPLLFIYPAVHCAVSSQVRGDSEQGGGLEWSQLPFIVSERGLARTRLDQWFRGQSIKPSIYAQVSGHEAIVSMVALGLGVGVVPELVLMNSPLKEKIQVLDVQPPLTPFAVGLCAASQRLDNPLVKAFWDCARASYPGSF